MINGARDMNGKIRSEFQTPPWLTSLGVTIPLTSKSAFTSDARNTSSQRSALWSLAGACSENALNSRVLKSSDKIQLHFGTRTISCLLAILLLVINTSTVTGSPSSTPLRITSSHGRKVDKEGLWCRGSQAEDEEVRCSRLKLSPLLTR